MLTKLLKHELKATSRYLVPLFLILFLFSILNRIVLSFDIFHGMFSFIPGFTMLGYVLSLVALVVVTYVILIIRFYKNLTSEEGYLMFTLPAKASQLINSKLLTSILWTVLSFFAILLSLFTLFLIEGDFNMISDAFQRGWQVITMEFGDKNVLFIIEVIILVILSIIDSILIIYVSIAIGQLFNGRKLLASFGAYIGIKIALQVMYTIIIAIITMSSPHFDDVTFLPTFLFPFVIIMQSVLNGIYYWVTNYLFANKLNLE